jgi:ribonucleoside-diphosphate reductase alpha chain
MHIARRLTMAGHDPYDAVGFRTATSEIRNPDDSLVFAAEGIEVPAEWSQVVADILAQKYFRKAAVPAALAPVPEEGVPAWLWRRQADETTLATLPENARSGDEKSARQVFDRTAGTWTYWGWKFADGMYWLGYRGASYVRLGGIFACLVDNDGACDRIVD